MVVIGRKDKIDLPEFELVDIEAKIDTGAYGCALHCYDIQEIDKSGENLLRFKVLDPEHPEFADKEFFTKEFSSKLVKSSSGESEERYTIRTEIVIFNERRTLEFSLTNRSEMKYPVLLGRKFLSKKYLVDVQLKDLSYNQKKKK